MSLESVSPRSARDNPRPHILCVVDGPDWIFSRHVHTLRRFLGGEFEISVAYRGQDYDEAPYDLLYPLEFDMVKPEQIIRPHKYVTGIRSMVSWSEWDFLTLVNYLNTHFQSVHVVSRELYDIFSPYVADLWHVTHGVDTEFFNPSAEPSGEPGKLRLGWAGNRDTVVKGFREYIEPLSKLPGVEFKYCGYADRNLTMEEMPGFYESIDAYISASSFEGNNNSLLEAAAMERAIVTTPAGAVPEYLVNNQSALIVDRKLEQFESAVLRLRDQPDLRISLGKRAREALLDGKWDWAHKAEDYREYFRSALNRPSLNVVDRIVVDAQNESHYAGVVNKQFVLVREMRIDQTLRSMEFEGRLNVAVQSLDEMYQQREAVKNRLSSVTQELASMQQALESAQQELADSRHQLLVTSQELAARQQEIAEIKQSETYRVAEAIKKFPPVRGVIWLYNKFIAWRGV